MVELHKHLSKQLRDQYPEAPSKGEERVYKLLGITKKRAIMVDGAITHEGRSGYNIPNSRNFPSSYVIRDTTNTRKNIVLIERMIPTDDPKKPKQQKGVLEFKASDAGEIRINAENYVEYQHIDAYLWFCPWLINNKNKDFHVPHKFGYLIVMEDREKKAKDFIEKDEFIHNAKSIVHKMVESDMNVMISQLKLGDYQLMTGREKQQKLLVYASDMSGAKRINVLASDKDTILRKMIRLAVDKKLIKEADSHLEMLWVKGEEVLCRKFPKKTLEDSLIMYFATDEGMEAMRIIKELLQVGTGKITEVKGKVLSKEKTKSKEKEVEETV